MPQGVIIIRSKTEEAAPAADALRKAGFDVEVAAPADGVALRALAKRPVAAFAIHLGRAASWGQAVALELRRSAAARHVPIVFIGGDPVKAARIRLVLPDAVYATENEVADAVQRAISQPPADPVTPGTMAPYAGVPLVKKLGIRAGATVLLVAAPAGFEEMLTPLPEGARVSRKASTADRVLLCAESAAELEARFAGAARRVREGGGLWILWPKGSKAITQAAVRKYGMSAGWVDYKICSVDRVWSGLLFSRRSL